MITGPIPKTRTARWSLLRDAVAAWFPPAAIGVQTGIPERVLTAAEQGLKRRLPDALREWFIDSGARDDVWSVQDKLLRPDELTFENGSLVFLRENQNVVRWSIREVDLPLSDPPVFVTDPNEPSQMHQAADSVSAFAIQMAALNSKFSNRPLCRANGQVTDEASAQLEATLRRLPIDDLYWPPFPTRLFGDPELIVELSASTWVWITARTSLAFAGPRLIAERAGVTWEMLNIPPGT